MDARVSGRQQQSGSASTSESSASRHWVNSQQLMSRSSRMQSDTHLPSSRDDRGGQREFVAHINFYNGR